MSFEWNDAGNIIPNWSFLIVHWMFLVEYWILPPSAIHLRSVGWRRSSLSISTHIQDPEITSSYPLLVKGDKVLSFEFWVLSFEWNDAGNSIPNWSFLIEHHQHPPPAFAPLTPAPPSKEDFLFFTFPPIPNWTLNVPCWILNIATLCDPSADGEAVSVFPFTSKTLRSLRRIHSLWREVEFWVLSGKMPVTLFLIDHS